MLFLRKILFPFAVLYGWITGFRNFLYDSGILKSYSFEVPVIAVGNLTTGGTGKTPQIEYLIRLLSPDYKVAVLSRGYKRKSKGFILAGADANAETLGDEPFQYYLKFPNIKVAVDADRRNGIQQLLSLDDKPQLILLDDAYQHRKVKAGLYILLTQFGDLYTEDWLLPTGNLREGRSGAGRADIIVVTKCPPELLPEEQKAIADKLKITGRQQLFFSAVSYDDYIYSKDNKVLVKDIKNTAKILVAGIAKPKPFFAHLQKQNDTVLTYPDHHDFSDSDLTEITAPKDDRIIVTTEKDYVRLQGSVKEKALFYLPIKTAFIDNKAQFDQTIINYVEKSTADS